jgi:hypothetical protein
LCFAPSAASNHWRGGAKEERDAGEEEKAVEMEVIHERFELRVRILVWFV